MRFTTGEVTAAQPTWLLHDHEGKLVAWAGDTFTCREHATRAAHEFRTHAAHARFELHQDRQGRWRWRASVDRDTVASSAEGYPTQLDARRAAHEVRAQAAHATPVHGRLSALRRTAD